MKAFMVFSDDPGEGCLLVYADTANEARSKSYNCLFSWDYIDTSARRVPKYDQYYIDGACEIIDDNSELPEGAPKFYNDSYL